jgi:hypothetical protein
MKEVNIFQDGKVCRNTKGTILKRKGKRILIEFVVSVDAEEHGFKDTTWTSWFKRRRKDNGGVYECADMNYWYYENIPDEIYEMYPDLVKS